MIDCGTRAEDCKSSALFIRVRALCVGSFNALRCGIGIATTRLSRNTTLTLLPDSILPYLLDHHELLADIRVAIERHHLSSL